MVTPESRVVVVHADEQPPIDTWHASVFLAGPQPRVASVPSWRPDALDKIRKAWSRPGTLTVFVPEARNWEPYRYDHHAWEERWLSIADVIAFWVPRDMATMPALNTNIEFGRWEDSGRIVFGAPPDAAHVNYLRECAQRQGAPDAYTLDQTIDAALTLIGDGEQRAHGHRDVPLLLWRNPAFAAWLAEQRANGSDLHGGKLLWVHDIGPSRYPNYWAFQARLTDTLQVIVSQPLPAT